MRRLLFITIPMVATIVGCSPEAPCGPSADCKGPPPESWGDMTVAFEDAEPIVSPTNDWLLATTSSADDCLGGVITEFNGAPGFWVSLRFPNATPGTRAIATRASAVRLGHDSDWQGIAEILTWEEGLITLDLVEGEHCEKVADEDICLQVTGTLTLEGQAKVLGELPGEQDAGRWATEDGQELCEPILPQ